MGLLEVLGANRILFDQIYILFVVCASLLIAFKVQHLYKLSSYRGLRYFRNAFIFFAIAFAIMFVDHTLEAKYGFEHDREVINKNIVLEAMIVISFQYAISVSGFYLLYSLVWKKVEKRGIRCLVKHDYCSKVPLLHIIALIIAIVDFIFLIEYPMVIIQLVVIGSAILLVLHRCRCEESEHKKSFLKSYLIVLILFFWGWFINLLGKDALLGEVFPYFWILQESGTALMFGILLYGSFKLTKHKHIKKIK